MGHPMYYSFNGTPSPVLSGAAHASIYPYGPFSTGDGRSVMLGLQNEREWAIFCQQVLQDSMDSRFVNNSQRTQNREDLQKIICNVFSTLSAEEVVEKSDVAGIANAKVNNMKDVWNHPQLRARGRWASVQTPAGAVPALIPPGFTAAGSGSLSQTRMDPVPAVGEHNKTIFAELGIHTQEPT